MALTPVNTVPTPNVGALLTGIVNPQNNDAGAWGSVTGPLTPPIAGPSPYRPAPAAPAAPTTPQTPPPPTTPQTPSGGFNPGIIDTFPGVANALALEQQGLGQLDGNLNAARQRLIIQFGDPALAGMAGFGLDPQAGAFAQQNYLSGNATLARLDKQHQQAAQSIINQLASHGLLNSGDLGYKEGQENQGYGNNVYDAQQGVLGQLADLFNNYLSSRYGLESNSNSARLAALQAFFANPDAYATLFNGANGGGAATTASSQPVASGVGSVLTGVVNPKVKAGAAAMRRALGNSQAPLA